MATDSHENQSAEHNADAAAPASVHAPAQGEGHSEGHSEDPLSPGHLFGHVQDSSYIELPERLGGKFHFPQPFPAYREKPLVAANPDLHLAPINLQITKFMFIEVVAAVLLIGLFVPLARRVANGGRPRGRLANLLEVFLVFLRDQVARPSIGRHDADKFLPFLWTIFLFVLMCNLLGLVPWLGSPTGALAVTGAMAFSTFVVVVGTGMKKAGFIGFFKSLVPHMDVPLALAVILYPLIFAIEFFGLLIKHSVLAIRLLANMVAGHLVMAVMIAFVLASAHSLAFYGVAPASLAGATALMFLELMVAFVQAYIFTFLSALFIGMAVHPH